MRSTSYIAYMLVFAVMAPASLLGRKLVDQLAELERNHCIVVMTLCATSRRDKHLMGALLWQLAKTAGLPNRAEAIVERQQDPCDGASYEVELRPTRSNITLWLEKGTRCEKMDISFKDRTEAGVPGKAELRVRSAGTLEFILCCLPRRTVELS